MDAKAQRQTQVQGVAVALISADRERPTVTVRSMRVASAIGVCTVVLDTCGVVSTSGRFVTCAMAECKLRTHPRWPVCSGCHVGLPPRARKEFDSARSVNGR